MTFSTYSVTHSVTHRLKFGERAGDEEWSNNRKRCQSAADTRDFCNLCNDEREAVGRTQIHIWRQEQGKKSTEKIGVV